MGAPWRLPFGVSGPIDKFGFGWRATFVVPGTGHEGQVHYTPGTALHATWESILTFPRFVFVAPVVLLLAGYVVARKWRDARVRLLVAMIATLVVAYFFWWGVANAVEFRLYESLGPFYHYLAVGPLAVLAAWGLSLLRPTPVLVAVLAIIGIAWTVPVTTDVLHDARRDGNARAAELALTDAPGRRLVLQDPMFPRDPYVRVANDPDLDGTRVVGIDIPGRRLDAIEQFPGRAAYLVRGFHPAGEPFSRIRREQVRLDIVEGARVSITSTGDPPAGRTATSYLRIGEERTDDAGRDSDVDPAPPGSPHRHCAHRRRLPDRAGRVRRVPLRRPAHSRRHRPRAHPVRRLRRLRVPGRQDRGIAGGRLRSARGHGRVAMSDATRHRSQRGRHADQQRGLGRGAKPRVPVRRQRHSDHHRDEPDQPFDRPARAPEPHETDDAEHQGDDAGRRHEVLPVPAARLQLLPVDLVARIPQSPESGDTRRADHRQPRRVGAGIAQAFAPDLGRPLRLGQHRAALVANAHEVPRAQRVATVGLAAVRTRDCRRRRDVRDGRLVDALGVRARPMARRQPPTTLRRPQWPTTRRGTESRIARQATGSTTNGTSSTPSARVSAANPAIAPATIQSHTRCVRAAASAHSRVESASGTKSVSDIKDPSAASSSGLIATSAAASSATPSPAMRRPTSPVSATVAQPVTTPLTCAARIESPANTRTSARNAGYAGGHAAGRGPGCREHGRVRIGVVLPDHAAFEEVPGRVDAEMQVAEDDEVVRHPQDRRGHDHECKPDAEGARPPRRAGHGRGSYGDGP